MNEDSTKKIPPTTETPQKALRTYEGDVADVLAHKNISSATIAIAENRKRSGEDSIGSTGNVAAGEEYTDNSNSDQSHLLKKSLIVLASLLLIGGGMVGAYYFYSISPLAPQPISQPQTTVTASIIPTDTRVAIAIDNMAPFNVINAVRAEIAKPQSNNTIKEIVLTQTQNGQRFGISAPDMVSLMGISAPDILVRALANDWMLGVYSDSQGVKTVFVITATNYFQNAFAGMLQWESVMADDLKQYLYDNAPADIAPTIATSTLTTSTLATSTLAATTSTSTISYPTSQPSNVLHGSFTDRIIQNNDVREFVTANGVLFLYSFIDNNTKLVVTGSEPALSAIWDRLEKKAFVR